MRSPSLCSAARARARARAREKAVKAKAQLLAAKEKAAKEKAAKEKVAKAKAAKVKVKAAKVKVAKEKVAKAKVKAAKVKVKAKARAKVAKRLPPTVPTSRADDTAYLTQLGLIRGHLAVGLCALSAGPAGAGRNSHEAPGGRKFTPGLEPAFAARGCDGFGDGLTAL